MENLPNQIFKTSTKQSTNRHKKTTTTMNFKKRERIFGPADYHCHFSIHNRNGDGCQMIVYWSLGSILLLLLYIALKSIIIISILTKWFRKKSFQFGKYFQETKWKKKGKIFFSYSVIQLNNLLIQFFFSSAN